MTLTRLAAIKITGELWNHLAETGHDTKVDWLGWLKYGNMQNDCPCCEYAIDSENNCPKCPLLKLWGKSKIGFFPCESNHKSPWFLWRWSEKDKIEERKKDRKKNARRIWKYCEKLLRKGKKDV